MGVHVRWSVLGAVMALVVAACSSEVAETTSTAPTPPQATTTTVPATATTTTPDRCPDVFCVVYHIHPEAVWSDGVPVTADDFTFTYEMLTDGLPEVAGYGLISVAAPIDDKTILFGFSQVYGPWQTMFPVVLPRHVLADVAGEEAQELALRTTAGPFVLDSWAEGDRIVLRRNLGYWAAEDRISGSPVGDVSEIQFVFPDSVRSTLEGLESGEIDVANPRPLDWMVADVTEMDSVAYQVDAGPFWEHIDFNHDDPLLSQGWVREVIDLSVDRQAILDETVRTVDPDADALDNTVWPANSGRYEAHYADRFNPEAAIEILHDHFCAMDDDGIYSCQGRKMSFTWATTVGDDYRQIQFELTRDFLDDVGIELVGDFRTPSDLFSSDVFFGGPEIWQIMNFSWKAGADPNLANSTYYCSGSAPNGFGALNVNRYCSDDVESLVRATDLIADQTERAGVYNEADKLYLGDLAIIPLYQKPSFMAWNADLEGPSLNMSRSTDLWNVAAWTGKNTVVMALQNEPEQPESPLLPADGELANVLAPLLQGAYGVSPGLEFVPVLIESAEIWVSED